MAVCSNTRATTAVPLRPCVRLRVSKNRPLTSLPSSQPREFAKREDEAVLSNSQLDGEGSGRSGGAASQRCDTYSPRDESCRRAVQENSRRESTRQQRAAGSTGAKAAMSTECAMVPL